MTEAARRKLAKRAIDQELEASLMPEDNAVKDYRELREKYKGKKMKTNLDLIE